MLRIIDLQFLRSRIAICARYAIHSAAIALIVTAMGDLVAVAAPINYGNFTAATVDFLQVTEDANSFGDNPPLFGAPTVAGNSLDFNPIGFSAAAAGAGGNDITDGQLTFMIMAHNGHAISNVGFSESGDTLLSGFGTDATFTKVTAEVFVDIFEVDGNPINQINVQADLVFTPLNGEYKLLTDGGGGPFFQANWQGSLSIDLNAALTGAGQAFILGATKVAVSLDNTLAALSEAGTSSFIAKKDFDALSITVNTPIPEPASVVLIVMGLAGVLGSRRVR